jgi:hypothetical protein
MSLTRFIKIPEIKERFTKEFKLPPFNLKSKILCPPVTTHYGLIGTAFDYLLRFHLKYHYPEAIDKEWVAKEAVDLVSIINPKFFDKAESMLKDSRKIYAEYLKSGKMNEGVIKATVCLAQLDPIYRAGVVDPNMGIIDNGDITDLNNLISCVNVATFGPKKVLMLNPTFGTGSELVGGADADLVIDNTLIDVKTTKYLELKRDDFHQLIGYYVLSKIGGVGGNNVKIDNLAIYFSRYGVIFAIPVDTIFENTNVEKFIDWFTHMAKKHYSEELL